MHTSTASRFRALFRLSRHRHGVVTLQDALSVGLAVSTFHQRMRAEGWTHLGGGAYLVPGVPLTRAARLHAVVLTGGPDIALSHGTALELHGLRTGPTRRIHATILHGQDHTLAAGAVRHRTRVREPGDVVLVDDLRVTSIPRTLADTAAGLVDHEFEAMLFAARQGHAVDLAEVRHQLARRPTLRGMARLRRALDTVGGSDADSLLEARVRTLLIDAGLEPTSGPHPVQCAGRTLHVDLAFPDQQVSVECDGYRYHHSRRAFEVDRVRWRLLTEANWRIVWVTWRQAHERPDRVVAAVQRALEGR